LFRAIIGEINQKKSKGSLFFPFSEISQMIRGWRKYPQSKRLLRSWMGAQKNTRWFVQGLYRSSEISPVIIFFWDWQAVSPFRGFILLNGRELRNLNEFNVSNQYSKAAYLEAFISWTKTYKIVLRQCWYKTVQNCLFF
jgi:hypothetical protein